MKYKKSHWANVIVLAEKEVIVMSWRREKQIVSHCNWHWHSKGLLWCLIVTKPTVCLDKICAIEYQSVSVSASS